MGEAGFDLYYEYSPRDEQEVAFRFQIQLAKRLGKALVIHSRDAWADTFRVLADEGVPDRTVFHCFTGGPDEAQRALDLGCYLSFSGIVSFKNAHDLRAAAAHRARRSIARRDGCAVPRARAVPRQAQRTGLRGRGRHRARVGTRRSRRPRRRDDARQRRDGLRRRVNPSELRALLERHGVRASKALGQHFLADPNTARRIIRYAGIEPGDDVVEVGPGVGSLTLALTDAGARVLALELDQHLVPVLREVVGDRSVEIVQGDAMDIDVGAVARTIVALGDGVRTSRTTSPRRSWCARSRKRR